MSGPFVPLPLHAKLARLLYQKNCMHHVIFLVSNLSLRFLRAITSLSPISNFANTLHRVFRKRTHAPSLAISSKRLLPFHFHSVPLHPRHAVHKRIKRALVSDHAWENQTTLLRWQDCSDGRLDEMRDHWVRRYLKEDTIPIFKCCFDRSTQADRGDRVVVPVFRIVHLSSTRVD